ncbi:MULTISPECIES: hypothetical protein [Bacillaceae]|uniref:hypothetical protein n=1 Tax=Bacillaceae TaxID=186817 RepID=UPI00126A7107|nr:MULTISPECIES: hypothetical protein [Bacillaceae]
MATRSVLVTILRCEMLVFGDEICSRHHFSVRNALFWRRASFSSPFLSEKRFFWRRDLFSSPFLSEKRLFLATRLVFVTIFE